MDDIQIQIVLVKQGENMGDHAQDVYVPVFANPDETVGALVDRTMKAQVYNTNSLKMETIHSPEYYLTIRVATKPNDDVLI